MVAQKAIDAFKARYGEGNKYRPQIFCVKYRNKAYQIEVVTRKKTIAATVITGARKLGRVYGND